ncbi:DMT family transporter [Alkalicoccobacillus murimartini]|uniref:Drug/metabolite transporter (DMT)-like permease n=1 Tax=Alkalicoccobacillus murimartini TaxID=171685 RepID=A0ABT9YCW1_9BACI|nr:DMT family transporter [Alkalicoccobacillus murimartini]MDQ0205683.1 drug/metabolite transporter (DMT)-like permease [Alkalicoccobacillus murimartini]
MSTLKAYIYTILGASCWGLIGLFVDPLYQEGFTAWEVVAIRGIFTFVFLIIFMSIWFRSHLKTRIRDHWIFAASGICSIAFFNYFYFEVFARSNLSLAVTLLYTGPMFVALLSRVFFKELLTKNKIAALVLSLMGCAFVVQLLPSGTSSIPGTVILMGVLSGFFYALYSIFTKPITKRYSPLTITTYTFLYTSVFMLLTSPITEKASLFVSPSVLVPAILLALVSTVGGYVFYTTGLKHLEASKASILATIEPVVAVISSVLFLNDYLDVWQLAGILAVLYSAVLVSRRRRRVVAGEKVA